MVAFFLHRKVVAERRVLVLLVAVRRAAPYLDFYVALLVFVVVSFALINHDERRQGEHEQTGEDSKLDVSWWSISS